MEIDHRMFQVGHLLWPRVRHAVASTSTALWLDRRSWNLRTRGFPSNAGVAVPTSTSATRARLLLEAGLALTPATSWTDPAAWFALFRYANAFAARSSALRLVAGAQAWDARITQVLAEELGVGVAIHLARTFLDVVHVADFAPLLAAGEFAFANPPVSTVHPKLRPDYMATLSTGQAILLEAKGVVGTESKLTPHLAKGKGQVRNIEFVKHQPRSVAGTPCGDRVVIGTHLCIEGRHARSETTSEILDPPGPVHSGGVGEGSDLAVRLSYAKAFNFAGTPGLGLALVNRLDLSDFAEATRAEMGDLRISYLGAAPWGDAIVMDATLAQLISRFGRSDIRAPVAERLQALAEKSMLTEEESTHFFLNNGIGLVSSRDVARGLMR